MRLSEERGNCITNFIIDSFKDFAIYFSEPPAVFMIKEPAFFIIILWLGKISEHIILLFNKREIDCFFSDGHEYQIIFLIVNIVIEIVDPGAMNGLHIADEHFHFINIKTKFFKRVIQPLFRSFKIVNIFYGISMYFE